MHDSNLDVNTWIARNNSTQLHTIDLNKGPISPPTAGATAPEETTGVTTQDPTPGPVTPTSLDEDEDQASSSVLKMKIPYLRKMRAMETVKKWSKMESKHY